jgi:hypothetical protein
MTCQVESYAQPYQFLGCLTLQLATVLKDKVSTRIICSSVLQETPAAEEYSLARRQEIFKAIKSRPLIHVSHLRVPKLPSMLLDDEGEVAALSVPLKGCEVGLAAMFKDIRGNESAVAVSPHSFTG